ncbi:MAG TPA: hypothetical protein DEP42_05300 [Ruminococcaceae bacterium]|nr:hypothetical protein [Oscillospiraceae bacterium]
MLTKTIQNIHFIEIQDDISGAHYYGCDQEWYPSKLQRMAGCGPTAFSTILQYLYASRRDAIQYPLTKSACVEVMRAVWKFITSGPWGVNTIEKLHKGAMAFAQANALSLSAQLFNIPHAKSKRPTLSQALTFLDTELAQDRPIAFLNLHNGEEKSLDSWHWVVITSVEYDPNTLAAHIGIVDEGKQKTLDFSLWYQTTARGGGLISFDMID